MNKDEALKIRKEQDKRWSKLINKQPLSDDEIKTLIHNAEFYNLDTFEFVRTVEQAHGIK
jgi:hypothetical protein